MVSQVPQFAPIAEVSSGKLLPSWITWFNEVLRALNRSAQQLSAISAVAQSAAIALTSLFTTTYERLYRISYYTRITQAATTSSSLTVTLRWTHGGVAQSYSGAAIVGNTVASSQTGSILVRADADTDISYETAYASVGATPMEYLLDIVVEALP